jgi:hypothetical protein
MRWRFEAVSGIKALNAIATDPAGTKVLGVSASARSASLLTLAYTGSSAFDVLGKPVCARLPCLVPQHVIFGQVNSPFQASCATPLPPPRYISSVLIILCMCPHNSAYVSIGKQRCRQSRGHAARRLVAKGLGCRDRPAGL